MMSAAPAIADGGRAVLKLNNWYRPGAPVKAAQTWAWVAPQSWRAGSTMGGVPRA